MKVIKQSLFESIIERYTDLEEVYFTNKRNLDRHYNKHVLSDEDGPLKMEYMPEEEYNELANTISEAPAGKLNNKAARIIGYVTTSGRKIKYDKNHNLTVVYVDDDVNGHEVIALYKQPLNKFFRKLNTPNTDFSFGGHLS